MSAPSSISRRRTFWPSGPVWCVFSCMPRISPDSFLTSSSERASLTPPPLPRPPAGVDLRLDHPDRAAQLLRRFGGFEHGERGVAAGDRHTAVAKDFLALV